MAGILLVVVNHRAGKVRAGAGKPAPPKTISIDLHALKKLLPFDYVQVFDIDRLEPPYQFTEHPVPSCGVPIRDTRFPTVSSHLMMRFARTEERPVMFVPREELLRDWEFDVVAVLLSDKAIPVLLFFYTRHGRPDSLDLKALSVAITT